MMVLTEYKGFQYAQKDDGSWLIILPSGLSSSVSGKTEQEIRDGIDLLAGS